MENVLREVIDIFPCRYIHIDGDEMPKVEWQNSPLAQNIIKEQKLKEEPALQSWFINRIEMFLNDHGRDLMAGTKYLRGD